MLQTVSGESPVYIALKSNVEVLAERVLYLSLRSDAFLVPSFHTSKLYLAGATDLDE